MEGFHELVKNWWDSFDFAGRPDYILASKLKALKDKLKNWNKLCTRSLERQKNNILAQISDLNRVHDERILSKDEFLLKSNLCMNFEKLAKNKEI